MRPGHGATRLGRQIRCDDAGFGIVEMVISLALLAIIIVPVVHIIVETQTASDGLHYRAEAADLATQALETAQYQTANGISLTPGITTSQQLSGKDPFTVALDAELVAGTGADGSICIDPPGQLSSQIWTVKATVSWGRGGQSGKVVESTLISPQEVDLADTNAAEIAVPVYNADQSPETTTPINITVTGTCVTGSCGTVPGNEETTESANSGLNGCAVFPDLFANAGEQYAISVSPPSGWVDPIEIFYKPLASATFGVPVFVQPNQVTVADNPELTLAQGALITMGFQTVSFTPVTVSGVSTTSGKANVTVTSGGFPGVSTGMLISGTGIPSGATVSSISGNTLTMSVNATATNTGLTLSFSGFTIPAPAPYLPVSVESSPLVGCTQLGPGTDTCVLGEGKTYFSSSTPQTAVLWPGPPVTGTSPNYSAWVGDRADSVPTGTATATPFQALSGTVTSVALPVYPLVLNVTVNSDAGTLTGMTATDAGGGDTLTLNGTYGVKSATGVATGLPLGQFQLAANGNGSSETVSPAYVWITPSGVCTGASVMSSCSSPSTSTIPVTVG